MCEECTQYFQNEKLLLNSAIKFRLVDDDDGDVFNDDENKENIKQMEVSSPKRSPLRENSKDDIVSSRTPTLNVRETPLKSASTGIMSKMKSAFKMTSTTKPIQEEIKEEETLDINSWTHSYTPPLNSNYALSPNISSNGIAAPEQSISSVIKVNRIATPESMINSPASPETKSTSENQVVSSSESKSSIKGPPESMISRPVSPEIKSTSKNPVVSSPEPKSTIKSPVAVNLEIESTIRSPTYYAHVLRSKTASIYTETMTAFPSSVHIATLKIILASILVVILATTDMMVPKKAVQLRRNDPRMSTASPHFQEFNYIEEIKYEIPKYTGEFSLSDPVHNRNQVGLFISNLSKMFKAIFDKIFGIKNDIMKSIDNLKQELKSKLIYEMRSFAKIF